MNNPVNPTDGTTDPAQAQMNLISSTRIRECSVYGANREAIGEIDHFMIDKPSGKVVYVMMRFGGFLGMGESLYPIPWAKLSYDLELDGYLCDVTREQLDQAAETTVIQDSQWREPDFNQRIHAFYGVPYLWM